ncbi:MAG: Rpn family recombination-promoting nuclease/putative transposase [Treponema sp.]|nr:Rpn family recombination-promoting nuclease/putative transposase [Treponema sp.]
MKINTNFKDSVFTKLFSEPDLLRELYCALEGTTLPPDLPVSINTLENVVFMDLYNDISFEIGGKLVVLIEHQSTINPNMALRLYLYNARVFERIIKGKNLYSRNRLSIPWPEFFVLYNGKEPYPDNATLRLSDLFEKPQDLGLPKKANPLLELEVKVININEGKNEAIVNRCKKLAEYSTFIAKTRSFEKDLQDREKAVKAAIKYCSRYDILKEFLETYASEVLNMLLTEWNTEDALAVRFEEGHTEGKREIAKNLLSEGFAVEVIQRTTGLSLEEIQEL